MDATPIEDETPLAIPLLTLGEVGEFSLVG